MLNTPCYKVDSINDNTIILFLSESVFEPVSSNVRTEIKEYLGKDCFVEEGKTSHNYKSGKVPEFDFTKTTINMESYDEVKNFGNNYKKNFIEGQRRDMRRNEVVSKIAEKTNISQETVELIIQSLQDTIKESLLTDERIFLDGFGVFEPRLIPERIGEHPITGNRVVVPPRKEVMFKAAADLKKSINVR